MPMTIIEELLTAKTDYSSLLVDEALILKDEDGKAVLNLKASVPWTFETIKGVCDDFCKRNREFWGDAYLGRQWIGSTEI